MAKRCNIAGLPGGEVSEAGLFYWHRHRQPITNLINYLPTVDLGDKYTGPVPSPGCARDCPACVGEHPVRREDGPPRVALHRPSTFRLLEEIVALAFLGAPPDGWLVSRVHHPDGNVWNNMADNLEWATIDTAQEWLDEKKTMGLMRRPGPPSRLTASRMGHYTTEPYFVGDRSVPGHLPTSPERTIGVA
jgi:hypothetical protein